jgi:hypothetical protein
MDAAAQRQADAAVMDQLTPAQIIRGLKLGGWVDLYSQNVWHRAQLVWASTRRTLFMFQSHNARPHSMTRRSCERLIRDRLLRPVDMQDVVARALQAIAEEVDAQVPESTGPDTGSAALEASALNGSPSADGGELELTPSR